MKIQKNYFDITYIQNGDYLIPNLVANEEPSEPLTKYGLMHKKWMKEKESITYNSCILDGTLQEVCLNKQKEAEEMLIRLIDEMALKEGITEKLKEVDQMKWVQQMNSIRQQAEEVVLGEVVFTH